MTDRAQLLRHAVVAYQMVSLALDHAGMKGYDLVHTRIEHAQDRVATLMRTCLIEEIEEVAFALGFAAINEAIGHASRREIHHATTVDH